MGVFDEVVNNAKSAASSVGKKAGRLVDRSKLHLSASELSGELSKRYEALGMAVYNAAKNQTDITGLIEECVISIDALYERLAAVNEKIEGYERTAATGDAGKVSSEDESLGNQNKE